MTHSQSSRAERVLRPADADGRRRRPRQSYVLHRTTDATLSGTATYRFRYQARPRVDAATTVDGSSADVKSLSCE